MNTVPKHVEVCVVRNLEQLSALSGEWDELVAASSTNQPFLSALWLTTWWQVFGALEGRQMRVLTLRGDGRLIGVAPLLGRRAWHRRSVPFRRLELLASGEREEDEICSDYIGFVARAGFEKKVAHELVGQLLEGAAGAWDELVLDAVDGGAYMTSCVVAELRARGLRVDELRDPQRCAPYAALPSTWEQYLDAMSSSRRAFVRRSLRKFEQWADDTSVMHVAANEAELDVGLGVLAELHRQRWSERGHSGVFESERFLAFHRQVMPTLLENGQLELAWLTVRGQPLVAVYSLLWDDRVLFYQGGRSLEVPKGVRPGIVMHAYRIQAAIAAGLREYDFLAGMGNYAVRLSTGSHPVIRIRATKRHSGPDAARVVMEVGVSLVKKLRRRVNRTEHHDDNH